MVSWPRLLSLPQPAREGTRRRSRAEAQLVGPWPHGAPEGRFWSWRRPVVADAFGLAGCLRPNGERSLSSGLAMRGAPAAGCANGFAASHLEPSQAAAPPPAARSARRTPRPATPRRGARGRGAELKGGSGSCDPLEVEHQRALSSPRCSAAPEGWIPPPRSVPSRSSLCLSLVPACSQLAGFAAWVRTPEQELLTHCSPRVVAPWSNANRAATYGSRTKAAPRHGASRMHRAEGAAPSPALGTCIPAHPAALWGDPLGPAPAGVIPVSPRARRGEEDPATPRALGRLRARAGSLGGSGLPLPLPPLSPGAHGQLAASAAFRNVPEQELQAFPSFTWKILFPSAITQSCLDGEAPVSFTVL